ncbi:MAG: TIGR04255 family protein, partial [Chromatiales bacterium]|nr:TIGR04255 family protein [Chromatiales bacterium]
MQSLPSFQRPPVIEVVHSVAFNPLSQLKAPHTGIFWAQIRDEFPNVQHAPPVNLTPGDFDSAGLPMPRIWFVSESENNLVQLQNNRFMYNWRIIRPDDEYPRFESVHAAFSKNFQRFQTFVADEEIGDLEIQGYELTYINHIDRLGKLNTLRNVGSLFPDLRWRNPSKRYLPVPSHLTWSMGFEFDDNRGRLVAELKTARRRNDDSEIFVLEMKATGNANVPGNEDATEWFNLAREWIVRGFMDLTHESLQASLWARDENA